MSTTTTVTADPAATTKVARVPHLRFAVNPAKIETFFERAIKRNVPIALFLADGTILTDLVPLKVNPVTFRVQNGVVKNVAKGEVKRIEYLY